MSRARPQSSKRKSMRTLYGSQNFGPKNSKRPNKRLQVINVMPHKKRGRKSNRRKWLEKLPIHIGYTKFIFHELTKERL